MTDSEFDVLDELYFVQSFEEVVDLSGIDEPQLVQILRSLHAQGWIKFLKDVDDEWNTENLTDIELKSSYFLATKKGLLAHNS